MKTVFGTKEWAEYSFNCINGCENNCRYCYAAKMAVRYRRKKTRNDWEKEIFIDKIIKKFNGRIMTPTTHDITSVNYSHVIKHIVKLLKVGNNLLIVSKMRREIAKKLKKDLEQWKNKIMFRVSIGSTKDKVLKFWEPNASCFEERLDSLKILHSENYETSVSVEPMLWNDIDLLIDKCIDYCSNSIWIGKMNNHNDIKNEYTDELKKLYTTDNILSIYQQYKNNSKIKWKESFKKIIGLELVTEKGLDK